MGISSKTYLKAILFSFLMVFSSPALFCQSEENEQENKNIFFRISDFVKQLPYELAFGCEPAKNGSTSFGSVSYWWTESVSSQVLFERKKTMESQLVFAGDMATAESVPEVQTSATIFPYKKIFVLDPDKKIKLSLAGGVEGALYTSKAKTFMCGEYEGQNVIADISYDLKIYGGSLCVEVKNSIPLCSFIRLGTELLFYPYSYYYGTNDYTFKINGINTYQANISNSSYGWGNFELKVHLDFFDRVGLVAQYNYERMKYFSNTLNEGQIDTVDYTNITNILRAGVALIKVNAQFVRIQTGFYSESKWITTKASGTNYTHGWVFSIFAAI